MPFRIQVANDGPSDANQVSLLVEGLNGTKVKSNRDAAQMATVHHLRRFGNVPAHSNGPNNPGPVVSTGNPFKFKQGADAAARDLVKVSVKGWSSSFDHMFKNHTQADPEANDVYNAPGVREPCRCVAAHAGIGRRGRPGRTWGNVSDPAVDLVRGGVAHACLPE